MTKFTESAQMDKIISFYCVIPARAGSKRIPNKNIQTVGNKPLISHVIENILASNIFDKVFVSTDSEEIAGIATSSGAVVPELRSKELSDDFTPTRQVIADFILRHEELQGENVVICCIYPFAMLVPPVTIRAAAKLVTKLGVTDEYIVSVKRYPHPIQKALLKNSNGRLTAINPVDLEKRTQDLAIHFHDAGQFYFAFSNTWILDKPILSNSLGYELGKLDGVDIDEVTDLEELRNIYTMKQNGLLIEKSD